VHVLSDEKERAIEVWFEPGVAGKIGKERQPFTALLAVLKMVDLGGRKLPAVAY
jgi:hypothetical protein